MRNTANYQASHAQRVVKWGCEALYGVPWGQQVALQVAMYILSLSFTPILLENRDCAQFTEHSSYYSGLDSRLHLQKRYAGPTKEALTPRIQASPTPYGAGESHSLTVTARVSVCV